MTKLKLIRLYFLKKGFFKIVQFVLIMLSRHTSSYCVVVQDLTGNYFFFDPVPSRLAAFVWDSCINKEQERFFPWFQYRIILNARTAEKFYDLSMHQSDVMGLRTFRVSNSQTLTMTM